MLFSIDEAVVPARSVDAALHQAHDDLATVFPAGWEGGAANAARDVYETCRIQLWKYTSNASLLVRVAGTFDEALIAATAEGHAGPGMRWERGR